MLIVLAWTDGFPPTHRLPPLLRTLDCAPHYFPMQIVYTSDNCLAVLGRLSTEGRISSFLKSFNFRSTSFGRP